MVYYSDRLDATFAALADPTRRAILERLAEGERTISELADGFEITLPAVSKHIRVLERAGLTRIERQGRVRRCSLEAAPMESAIEWLERYRRYWEASFDRLAAYLAKSETEESERWTEEARRERKRRDSSSGESSTRRERRSSRRGRRKRD